MMKGSMSTDLGIITINPEVIAKYAGSVAVECFGIVGMAAVSVKDGMARLLKRESLDTWDPAGDFRGESYHTEFSCDRFLWCKHSFCFRQPEA